MSWAEEGCGSRWQDSKSDLDAAIAKAEEAQQRPLRAKRRRISDAFDTEKMKAAAAEEARKRQVVRDACEAANCRLKWLTHDIDPQCPAGGGIESETLIENPHIAHLFITMDEVHDKPEDPQNKRKALLSEIYRRSPGLRLDGRCTETQRTKLPRHSDSQFGKRTRQSLRKTHIWKHTHSQFEAYTLRRTLKHLARGVRVHNDRVERRERVEKARAARAEKRRERQQLLATA